MASILLLSVASALAEPLSEPPTEAPQWDKNVFDVQVEGALGSAPRVALRGRVVRYLALDGSVRGPVGWNLERYGLGAAWTPQGHGLQGVAIGVRAHTGRWLYTDGDWSTDLEPNVAYHWIAWSGFGAGVELGLDARLCCESEQNVAAVRPVVFGSLSWAFAIGEQPPSKSERFAALTPEERALQEPAYGNKRIVRMVLIDFGVTIAAVGGAAVLGFAVFESAVDDGW